MERIKSFEKFSKTDEKLEKRVIDKKTICIDKNGKIGWIMREGTNLACPKSTRASATKPAVNNQLGLGSKPTPTNKKQRFCEGKEEPIRLQNQYDITDD